MKKISFRMLSALLTVVLLMLAFATPVAAGRENDREKERKPKYELHDGTFTFDDGTKITVKHASPNSVLTVSGGPDKCEEALELKEEIVLDAVRANITEANYIVKNTRFPFNFSATPAPFGNGIVTLRQNGERISHRGFWIVTRTVNGTTQTNWTGTQPQINSDQIKLNESWTFHGISVEVSIPPGVGFSRSANTVSWSAHDTSGAQWRMRHDYIGVQGGSNFALTGSTKAGTGSHRFQGWQWISTSESSAI